VSERLRIAVADDERSTQDYFEDILTRMGHEVVVTAGTGRELIECCERTPHELVITDIKMPDMDGIEAAHALFETGGACPVILVSAFHDQDLIERSQTDPIMGYLIKPISMPDLEVAIPLAMCRFRQAEELARESESLRQALEDRKIVEKAKGILMRQSGLDEEEAFRRLQKAASRRSMKMVDLARTILTAEEILADDEDDS